MQKITCKLSPARCGIAYSAKKQFTLLPKGKYLFFLYMLRRSIPARKRNKYYPSHLYKLDSRSKNIDTAPRNSPRIFTTKRRQTNQSVKSNQQKATYPYNMPNVLLIEDDERITSLIVRSLQEQEFTVMQAFDGVMGKKLAIANNYDIIISDIILPQLNGLDLCKESPMSAIPKLCVCRAFLLIVPFVCSV
ncbi:response regulator [Taibaiella soli]|uniref:Response regulatory domain-containing protein n=1 Tax=Taibaiella soli TaxID=1649169 RepID=A0A2W2BC68_9BACT|nr:response regulator [Taibaiella soli]PZF71266.1 hypothetical protein DN068_18380 [Taibaiella soli]